MLIDKLLVTASSLMPQRWVSFTEHLLAEADFEIPARKYVGLSLWISYFLGLIAFSLMLNFADVYPSALVGLGSFVISIALFYFLLNAIADGRAHKIEETLPDALQMISANMRAGMTLESAVLASARPEFGPLEDEIRRVSTKAYGGMSMSSAFKEMADRVRSQQLKRAMRLIIEGSALGGQMAQLLHEISRDLRDMASLRREIANATVMYTMFIAFSTVIASPILFATSIYYMQMNEMIMQSADFGEEVPATAAAFGGITAVNPASSERPSAEEMNMFSLTAIILTTFFAALTIGYLRKGKAMYGLKYAPAFVIGALMIFFLATLGLTEIFKSFIG